MCALSFSMLWLCYCVVLGDLAVNEKFVIQGVYVECGPFPDRENLASVGAMACFKVYQMLSVPLLSSCSFYLHTDTQVPIVSPRIKKLCD